MVGVAKENLNPKLFQNVLRHAFYRTERADGHEDRSLDFAMRRGNSAQAGGTIGGFYGENASCHSETLLLRRGIPIVTFAL
jgi:hypothetical protein